MALILVTGPETEPVTLAEAKLHCRVDLDTDDALIGSLITAAREYVERVCRPQLALISQTWRYVADELPASRFELRPYPLRSVSSIVITDDDGNETTYSSANYLVDLSLIHI